MNQRVKYGENSIVQQIEPQPAGGRGALNKGHSGDSLLLTILPPHGRPALPTRTSSHSGCMEAGISRVLSELLRPWRRMEFKDQPDLQGQGGGTGAYIGEPDRPDWLSRPLGAAKDRQS